MFKYEKDSYNVESVDDENYYWVMIHQIFHVFSPFDVSGDDFPNKDKLGGVVLKFIGSGAAYFKVQREMPSRDEVQSMYELCKFLQNKYGGYVVACVACEPHIEIHDINVPDDEHIYMNFFSARKSHGDTVLDILMKKIENKEAFTVEDHVLRVLLPFMGRKDDDDFQLNYLKFTSLFRECQKELQNEYTMSKSDIYSNYY